MEAEWGPVRDDAAAQQVWQTVLRPIAGEMSASSAELAHRVIDRIRVEQPHLLPDAQFAEGQPAGIESSIRQLAQTIADGADPRGLDLPEETIALGRARVQQRVPLAYLIRSYRLAQDTIWEWLFGTHHRVGLECHRTGRGTAAGHQLAVRLHRQCARPYRTDFHEREREAWLRSAAAARTTAIDYVVSERERDAQRAAKKLRYDLNRNHIGVTMWLELAPEDVDAQQILADTCSRLASAVSAETTLTQAAGPLSMSGWLSRRDPFDLATLESTAVLRSAGLPTGVRLAFGELGWGLKGFQGSYLRRGRPAGWPP